MLKGHLRRVMYHQVYSYTTINKADFGVGGGGAGLKPEPERYPQQVQVGVLGFSYQDFRGFGA